MAFPVRKKLRNERKEHLLTEKVQIWGVFFVCERNLVHIYNSKQKNRRRNENHQKNQRSLQNIIKFN